MTDIEQPPLRGFDIPGVVVAQVTADQHLGVGLKEMRHHPAPASGRHRDPLHAAAAGRPAIDPGTRVVA